jgi:4-amino-4-deoxy-L-arabinose transferase-like glycosyltransferase
MCRTTIFEPVSRYTWGAQTDRRAALAIVAIAGLVHTVARRWSMNPDGISYLDIADRYAAGEWTTAINGTWSPALSWLFAGAFRVVGPSPAFEFTLVHLTIYGLYLLAFFAFEWFLRALAPQPRPWYWTVFAYAVFLWATLFLVDLQDVTPDIAAVGLTFAAAALALSIRRDPERVSLWVALGVVVGAAYLAKAVMLYVGLALVVTTAVATRRARKRLVRILAVTAAIVLVAGPWIVALSITKGRFTTGDVGAISIAWFVNGVTPVQHWQGLPREFGTPVHPTRQLLAAPHVYEFASPIAGTHPPRFDPSYWYEGVQARVDIRRMAGMALTNIGTFAWLLVPLAVGVAALVRDKRDVTAAITHWPVLVPMLVGLGLFAVVYFETRYVSAFVAVLYLCLLAPFAEVPSEMSDAAPNATARNVFLVITVIVLAPVAYHTALRALQARSLRGENPYWKVAQAVDALGIPPGSPIAVIGNGYTAYWARLGRYRVVAEIPPPQTEVFWRCDDHDRNTVLEVLASTGAVAVVAIGPPAWAHTSGWTTTTGIGPLVAQHFVPRSVPERPRVSPSYLDYRVINPCAPRRL